MESFLPQQKMRTIPLTQIFSSFHGTCEKALLFKHGGEILRSMGREFWGAERQRLKICTKKVLKLLKKNLRHPAPKTVFKERGLPCLDFKQHYKQDSCTARLPIPFDLIVHIQKSWRSKGLAGSQGNGVATVRLLNWFCTNCCAWRAQVDPGHPFACREFPAGHLQVVLMEKFTDHPLSVFLHIASCESLIYILRGI